MKGLGGKGPFEVYAFFSDDQKDLSHNWLIPLVCELVK